MKYINLLFMLVLCSSVFDVIPMEEKRTPINIRKPIKIQRKLSREDLIKNFNALGAYKPVSKSAYNDLYKRKVKNLIEKLGGDVVQTEENDPLAMAVKWFDADFARYLLDNRAKIDFESSDHKSALDLFFALENKELSGKDRAALINLLLLFNTNQAQAFPEEFDRREYLSKFEEAQKEAELESRLGPKKLYRFKQQQAQQKKEDEQLALFNNLGNFEPNQEEKEAYEESYKKPVQAIIEQSEIIQTDENNPLVVAILMKDLEFIEYLLHKNSDITFKGSSVLPFSAFELLNLLEQDEQTQTRLGYSPYDVKTLKLLFVYNQPKEFPKDALNKAIHERNLAENK